jgi:hypothetical protein
MTRIADPIDRPVARASTRRSRVSLAIVGIFVTALIHGAVLAVLLSHSGAHAKSSPAVTARTARSNVPPPGEGATWRSKGGPSR